jgi:membrane-associated phospholipid phosphatase
MELCIFLHKTFATVMLRKLFTLACSLTVFIALHAQDSLVTPVVHRSPYRTRFMTDGPVIVGGLGLTLLGYSMIVNKDNLTATELASRKKENIPWFDRGNAGYFNDKANDDSYIPFFASFALPIAGSLIDRNQRSHFLQVTSLYLETMAISGALYTLTAGAISRSRPLVYNTATPYDRRVSNNSQRSFFAGHVSATASATFFAAQVFSDFNPDSKAKPYIWAAAAALPALVGYYRYEAGQHFLSDILLGYGIGMATGILIPKLHRHGITRSLSVTPQFGNGYRGLALVYRLPSKNHMNLQRNP